MRGPWGRSQDVKLMISHLRWMPESLDRHEYPFLKLDLSLPGSMSTGFSVFIQKCSPLISLSALFNDVCKETEKLSWIHSVGFTQSFLGFFVPSS